MLPSEFEEIKRALPDVPGARIRIGMGYIFSYLQSPPDAVEASLRRALQLAEETNTPLLIQLDGENWWDARPDLWNWWDSKLPGFDPANARLSSVAWSVKPRNWPL